MFRASQIQGEGFITSGVQQNLNPSYWHIECTTNCQKWNRIEKVTLPQSRGGSKIQKIKIKKSLNVTKASSRTPKKFFVCRSVGIRVPR
jgi:hypothetical protein